MADGELTTPKLSEAQVNALMRPMEMDLMAAYTVMQDDAFGLMDKAITEGWTPERFMAEVEQMFDVDEEIGNDLVAKALPRVEFQGLPITIENRPGSVREGKDQDGHPWQTKMKAPYGFIRGTEGADGDEVDVFIGPDIMSPWVYVFHIAGPDDDGYDEDKVVLGCADMDDAARLLLSHYDQPIDYEPELFFIEDFREMLDDTRGEPIAGEMTRVLLEAQKSGVDKNLVQKAMQVAAIYYVAKAAKVLVGATRVWGGALFVRVSVGMGKWKDWKKLGKAPEGMESGDPLPEKYGAVVPGEAMEASQWQEKPAKKPPKAPKEEEPKAWSPVEEAVSKIKSTTKVDDIEDLVKDMSEEDVDAVTDKLNEMGLDSHADVVESIYGAMKYQKEGKGLSADEIKEKAASIINEGFGQGQWDKVKEEMQNLTDTDMDEMIQYIKSQGYSTEKVTSKWDELQGESTKVDQVTASGQFVDPAKNPKGYAKQMAEHLATPLDELVKLEDVKELANLGGTTGGGARHVKYKDPAAGGAEIEGVLKTGASPEHVREEVIADSIYELMGATSKGSVLVRDENGAVASRSEFLQGYKEYGSLMAGDKLAAQELLKEHFVVDALLANWDVTGASGDNIMIKAASGADPAKAVRIDNGGALRYRAQGAEKGGGFSKLVVELDTMRDPNKLAGKMFSSVTDAEIKEQIEEVVAKEDAIYDLVKNDASLKAALKARIGYLKTWKKKPKAEPKKAAKLQTKTGQGGATVPIPNSEQDNAIRLYKGSTYQSMNAWLREYAKTETSGNVPEYVKHMSDYLDQCPKQKVDTWRGAAPTVLKGMTQGLGFPKFTFKSKADLLKKGPEGYDNWLGFFKDWLVGVKFGDNGFISTSEDAHTAAAFAGKRETNSTSGGGVILKIDGKPRCFSMKDAVNKGSESEWVLNRGTRYIINDVKIHEQGDHFLQFDVGIYEGAGEAQSAEEKKPAA